MAIEPAVFGKNRTISIIIIVVAAAIVFVFLFFRLRVASSPSRLSPELQKKQQEAAEEKLNKSATQTTQMDGVEQGSVPPALETPDQKRERQIDELNQLFDNAANDNLASLSVDFSQAPQKPTLSPEEADRIRQQQLSEMDALVRYLKNQ